MSGEGCLTCPWRLCVTFPVRPVAVWHTRCSDCRLLHLCILNWKLEVKETWMVFVVKNRHTCVCVSVWVCDASCEGKEGYTLSFNPPLFPHSLHGRPNNHFGCTILIIAVATGIELGLHGNTLSWFLDQGRIVNTHTHTHTYSTLPCTLAQSSISYCCTETLKAIIRLWWCCICSIFNLFICLPLIYGTIKHLTPKPI